MSLLCFHRAETIKQLLFTKYCLQIITDSECNLKSVESYHGSYSTKYQYHIPCSFAYKLVCVDDEFSKSIVVFRGENTAFKFAEAILQVYQYCK